MTVSIMGVLMKLHDEIREIAKTKFVLPAHRSSQAEFSIAIKNLMREAEARGIATAQRVPAFCNAIQTREFLEANGIDILRIDGPQSKKSTTVVVHYRLLHNQSSIQRASMTPEVDPLLELSGVLRGAIREGAAAFLKELRKDKEARDSSAKENAA